MYYNNYIVAYQNNWAACWNKEVAWKYNYVKNIWIIL